MNVVIRHILLVYLGLLPIVNPLGMAPIFAEMTLGYSEAIRRTVAMRVAINGLALLVASLFIGSYILQFFGISLAAVQLGGVWSGCDEPATHDVVEAHCAFGEVELEQGETGEALGEVFGVEFVETPKGGGCG